MPDVFFEDKNVHYLDEMYRKQLTTLFLVFFFYSIIGRKIN